MTAGMTEAARAAAVAMTPTGEMGQPEQIAQVNKMIYSVSQRAVALRNLALLKEPELKQEELAAIAKADEAYREAHKELLALIARFDASEAEKALLDALAEQNAANARNQELYMGMMSDLASQMSSANQQVAQAGPYAVTTSAAAPAAGAQTTSAIAARRKPLANTSLAIGPLTAAGLGTGLNIAV